MDTLLLVSLFLNVCVGIWLAVLFGGSDNRRRAAAWLLASAQEMDEIRRARLGIRAERMIRQADLEQRLIRSSAIDTPDITVSASKTDIHI